MVNWVDQIDGTIEGTPVNRKNLMAMQGFESLTTVFGGGGVITETNAKGETMVTAFNTDRSITETFTGADGITITKRTVFNIDGSIREAVTE